MSPRLPAILAAPALSGGRWWLGDVRLFDGTGGPVRERAGVLVDAGRIASVGDGAGGPPPGVTTIDLRGCTLLPGLIDAHAHVYGHPPTPEPGAEPLLAGTDAHFLASGLREALRMGITTLRDVGSYGDRVVECRQAMRYGAFRGPRLLTCGRIVSATSPGGRSFDGMYREADGPDQMRQAVREQLRRGADFIKVMTTGARSVELEDPDPAQVTPEEVSALVGEAHRMGRRVAAHAEGLAGTELAVDAGIETIEHGMYLHRRPDLLERMASAGQVLVPTLSCFYGVAGLGDGDGPAWSPLLVDLARHNLAEADLTLRAALAAGVPVACGHDWAPLSDLGLEIMRMADHGLSAAGALVAATATAASALGLADQVGTVEAGKLADLVVIEGDPLADLSLLRRRDAIRLVFQLGEPVAGRALERDAGDPLREPPGLRTLPA